MAVHSLQLDTHKLEVDVDGLSTHPDKGLKQEDMQKTSHGYAHMPVACVGFMQRIDEYKLAKQQRHAQAQQQIDMVCLPEDSADEGQTLSEKKHF